LPVSVRAFAPGSVFGAGSFWTSNDTDAVLRVDPATHRVTARIETGALTYPSLAFADGALWLSNHAPSAVLRIDPASNRVVRTIPLGKVAEQGAGPISWAWLAIGDRSFWIADHYVGTVSRVDERTGKVVATIPVPGFPNEIQVGEGGVWVSVAINP
jgi:streptogramin lyase